MAATNNYRSSVQHDSFLVADPLHLSANGALDDFDFSLGTEGEESERLFAISSASAGRLFANSNSSADMDVLLCDSRGSVGMDFQFQFESLTGSLNRMSVNSGANAAVHENKKEQMAAATATNRPSSNYRTARQGQNLHESWPCPGKQKQKLFQINAVNFDPPSEPPKQGRHKSLQPMRPESHDDLPTCSSSIMNQPQSTLTEDQYHEALQKLADSMKRTGESRKHVIMQRTMLTPSQQQALSSAKEQLSQGQHQSPLCQVPPSQDVNAGLDLDDPVSRSSTLKAFFSGSRGTLTNGLEHSRKQLGLYVGSVNNQTI